MDKRRIGWDLARPSDDRSVLTVVMNEPASGDTGFEGAVAQEVSKRLCAAAADIRKRARKFGGNIEGAMMDIAAAMEEASGGLDLAEQHRQIEEYKEQIRKKAATLELCEKCGGSRWSHQAGRLFCLGCKDGSTTPAVKTSRCCNAPIAQCDGRPMCSKCRLTGRGV